MKPRLRFLIVVIFVAGIIFIHKPVYAVFELIADNSIIDFGFMNISENKHLKEKGSYHNQITCTSDNDNTWYLKIHLAEPFNSGSAYIPYESFQWRVTSVANGSGIVYNENEFRPFLDIPVAVYTSGPNDNSGTEVSIRFDYQLSIPKNQLPGNYRSAVRYTLSELL